ncbi:MAG: hypothetical protein ACOZQL_37970 [Myxococcota bacterium]
MLEHSNVMVKSFLWLVAISFGVWVFTAGKSYRETWRESVEGFRLGGTRMVEVTLVASDKQGLACASDKVVDELHCGYRANSTEAGPVSTDDPKLLQPFYTVGGELILGAGLWLSPGIKELPSGRFTVVCNFHVVGVTRAVAIRFAPGANFGNAGKLVPVGTLSECVFP